MTKNEAQIILDLIHATEPRPKSITVEKAIQSVVDKYIDNLIKNNPKLSYSSLKSDTSRKTNNFIRPFEIAFSKKLKSILNEIKKEEKSKPIIPNEKRFLIKEVAKILDMTPQNLNHLLRTHPEITVIEISSRKRYLTESEIKKVKKL